jgi:hypothetical protein
LFFPSSLQEFHFHWFRFPIGIFCRNYILKLSLLMNLRSPVSIPIGNIFGYPDNTSGTFFRR